MIYRDSLDIPDAIATIDYHKGSVDMVTYPGQPPKQEVKPSYYYMFTASNAPTKKWPGETSVDEIVAEMDAEGWSCTVETDIFGMPRIRCVHRETQTVIDAQKAAEAEKFDGAVKGWVRFGELPEGGRSKNYRDNTFEAGVSCFKAEFASDGSYRLLLTPVLQVSYLTVADRQAYRLYGEEIGTGSDGEPLLRVSKAVAIG